MDALADQVTALGEGGITELELEALESGRSTMSGLLPYIAVALDARPEWLMMGDGPMREGGVDPDIEPRDPTLGKDERRLLRGYRSASPKMRKAFLRFADFVALAMNPNYERFIAEKMAENEGRDDGDED